MDYELRHSVWLYVGGGDTLAFVKYLVAMFGMGKRRYGFRA